MITLRCTQKVLRRLDVVPIEPIAPPTNVLGDWYVNLVRVGAEQLVLATSERSYLSVVLAARDLRRTLLPGLCRSTFELLTAYGVERKIAEREIEAMRPVIYAATASRNVLGVMTEFGKALKMWRRDRRERGWIMRALAEELVSVPGTRQNEYLCPAEKAVELLTGRAMKVVRTMWLDDC
jgi:hypothetical protein